MRKVFNMAATLLAKERTDFRRSSLTKIREEGNIPAVIYGEKVENLTVSVSAKELIKTIREVGRNGVISLEVDGNTHNVILSDYQSDPIRNEVIHADFLAVDMTAELTVDVSVVLVGEADGEKDGGVIQQTLHEISVTATPNNIPQSIEVNISELQVAETIAISDIKSGSNYEINNEEDEVIVTILPPQQEEEISTGEEQEAGTPDNLEGRETEAPANE